MNGFILPHGGYRTVNQMIQRARAFLERGGIRERMTRSRIAIRPR